MGAEKDEVINEDKVSQGVVVDGYPVAILLPLWEEGGERPVHRAYKKQSRFRGSLFRPSG